MLSLCRRSRILAGACCLLGLFFAGALAGAGPCARPPPELDAEGREIVILGGCVVEPPAISGERERFLLELAPQARAQVTLYTKEGEPLPSLRYGQNIELDARVRKPRNYGNPGAFDYAHFLARQNIYWTASRRRRHGPHSAAATAARRCAKAAMDLRAAVLRRTEQLYHGDDYLSGMMQAMLMGQNFQLQSIWTEEYRDTGTFHVIVISGTHVAILAAFFLFLLRLCFVPRNAAMLLTAAAAWLYAMTSGWGAPCVRCAAGLTLYMIAGYFYRERRAAESAGRHRALLPGLRPRSAFRSQLSVELPGRGLSGSLRHAAGRRHFRPAGARPRRPARYRPRPAPAAARGAIPHRNAAAGRRPCARLRLPGASPPWRSRCRRACCSSSMKWPWSPPSFRLGLALPMVVYFHRLGLSGLSANAFAIPLMGLAVPIGFRGGFHGLAVGGRRGRMADAAFACDCRLARRA